MMELSIILITWNSDRFVKDCLDSVWRATEGMKREFILIDNNSTDTTRELLLPYINRPDVSFFPQTRNLGVAKARNIGLRQAKGRFVWLLDIDTVANREAREAMTEYMDTHDDCGLCGCKLVNSAGQVQDSCRRYPSFRFKMYNVLSSLLKKCKGADWMKSRIERLNESQFYHRQMKLSDAFEVEYIIGACQFIRKKAIEQVGLLDEHIFYGPEDADFCLRAGILGWKVCYLPSVSFIHEYQQITSKRLFSRMSWVHMKALFYFFWKHKRI